MIDTMQEHKHASLNIQSLYDVLTGGAPDVRRDCAGAVPDDVRQDLSVYPRMQKPAN